MSKKGLQQPNIVPYSISVISNNPDVSSVSFAGLFEEKRNKEEPGQYRIKVKRPYDNNMSRGQGQLSTPTKSNMGQKTINYDLDLSPATQINEPIITPEMIPLTPNLTGYQICKTSFSEQQILEAFKVLDINKDESITEQDITFFLQYIKQPYTQQEVKQMINMISGDGRKVTWQQFKRIGKGTIIPFADIKVPDEKIRKKKVIYENISNNQTLYEQNPSIILNASQNEIISMKKFEQFKKQSTLPLQIQTTKTIDEQQELQFLYKHIPLLSQQEFQARRQLFNGLEIVNVTQVIRNYKQIDSKLRGFGNAKKETQSPGFKPQQSYFIDIKNIAKMFQISQKQVKLIYPSSQQKQKILTKRVALQSIAYSQLNKIKKLQMSMAIFLKKKTINFQQLYFLLQILKGKDQKESLRKKLLTVLKSKNIAKNQQIDKFYVLELINTFSYQFNF